MTNLGGIAQWTAVADVHLRETCTSIVKSQPTKTWPVESIVSGSNLKYQAGNAHVVVANSEGDAVQIVDGKHHPMEDRSVYATKPFHVPALLLASALSNAHTKYSPPKTESVGGGQAIHVTIEDTDHSDYGALSVQDWYFDSQSGDPVRVDYLLPALTDVSRVVKVSIQFTQYKALNGLRTPSEITKSIDGSPNMTCSVDAFTVNEHPDASVFTVPQAGAN